MAAGSGSRTRRMRYWRMMRRARIPYDRKFARAVRSGWSAMIREAAGMLASGIQNPASFGLDDSRFLAMWRREYFAAAMGGARIGLREFGRIRKRSRSLSEEDITALVGRQVEEQIEELAPRVSAYTRDAILAVASDIADGISDADGVDEIAKRIKARLGAVASVHRSFRIARTEVLSAMNIGSQESIAAAARESGSTDVWKVWTTSGDDRVRHAHAELEGQRQPYDGLFQLPGGVTMIQPGDRSRGAPASQVIHCRCVAAPELGRPARRWRVPRIPRLRLR